MLKKFIAWLKSWRMSDVDLDLMGTPCRSFEDAGRMFLKGTAISAKCRPIEAADIQRAADEIKELFRNEQR